MGEGRVLWLSTKWELLFHAIFQAGGIMYHAIYTVSLGAQTEEEKKRENERKKLLTKKFPISPAILQEQTAETDIWGQQ